jgi:hypothetical protein
MADDLISTMLLLPHLVKDNNMRIKNAVLKNALNVEKPFQTPDVI